MPPLLNTQSSPPLPRWATITDAGAMLALFLGVAVSVGGGFRASVGELDVSVTTPVRPLVAAALLLLTRHYLLRRPDIVTRVRRSVAVATASDGWRAAWPPFVATRAALVIVGVMAVYTVGYSDDAPPIRASESEVLNLPLRWDAGWYREVARSGYRWNPLTEERQQNIAFFPAYPMMVRTIGRVFGGREPAFTLGGAALSHLLFLWALVLLYRFARDETGDEQAARGAVLLLACYPFSIFHGGVYTESLFLAGSLGAWLAFRDGRWERAAVWGLLVGLARPNGMLLSAVLLTLAYVQKPWREPSPAAARGGLWVVAAIAPVVGASLYSMFIWTLTGNPLQWVEQHAAWGRGFTGGAPFVKAASFAAEHGLEAYAADRPYQMMNGVAALGAVALIVPVGLRLGPAAAVFVAVNAIPPLLAGGPMSMGRLSATLFPLFIWLALAAGRHVMPVAIAFSLLQALAAVLFYTWRPLF